jgi:hypothetical protein
MPLVVRRARAEGADVECAAVLPGQDLLSLAWLASR